MRRYALQYDQRALAHERDRSVQHDGDDDERRSRVEVQRPFVLREEVNEQTRREHKHGRHCVAEVVDEDRPHVHIVRVSVAAVRVPMRVSMIVRRSMIVMMIVSVMIVVLVVMPRAVFMFVTLFLVLLLLAVMRMVVIMIVAVTVLVILLLMTMRVRMRMFWVQIHYDRVRIVD